MQTNYNSIFTDEKRLDIFFDAGLFQSGHITCTSKKSLVYFAAESLVYFAERVLTSLSGALLFRVPAVDGCGVEGYADKREDLEDTETYPEFLALRELQKRVDIFHRR